jgi:hypothetical protein
MCALGAGIASAADTGPQGLLDPAGQVLSAPVSATGNTVSVLDDGALGTTGGQVAADALVGVDWADRDEPLIAAPVTVQDNEISVIGTDGTAEPASDDAAAGEAASDRAEPAAIASVPVTVTDNAVAVLGRTGDTGPAGAAPAPAETADAAVVEAPVTICGTTAAVLGDAAATCADQPDAATASLVEAPVTVCGTSVAVAGDSASTCPDRTGGTDAALVAAPVNVCGTSVSVLGEARFACTLSGAQSGPAAGAVPVEVDAPAAVGDDAAPAAPPAEAPADAAGPEFPDLGAVQPESDGADEAQTRGLAYTGTDLAGIAAAGMLLLVLGAGAAWGTQTRSNGAVVTTH